MKDIHPVSTLHFDLHGISVILLVKDQTHKKKHKLVAVSMVIGAVSICTANCIIETLLSSTSTQILLIHSHHT